jgi:hypothetical protein
MHACMHACMHAYTYTYIHTHTHTHTHTNTYYTHPYMHTHTHTYTHTQLTHAQTHTQTHTYYTHPGMEFGDTHNKHIHRHIHSISTQGLSLGTQATPATVPLLTSSSEISTVSALVHLLQCPSTFTSVMDVSSNFSKVYAQVHLLYKVATEGTFENLCLLNTSNTLATHEQHISITLATH